MRKVDDVEQAKNHRQTQAEHGVERAIDQAQHELAQKRLVRDAEDLHRSLSSKLSIQTAPPAHSAGGASGAAAAKRFDSRPRFYFLTKEQRDSAREVKAWSPGTLATNL